MLVTCWVMARCEGRVHESSSMLNNLTSAKPTAEMQMGCLWHVYVALAVESRTM
jgi:hypothetical protein